MPSDPAEVSELETTKGRMTMRGTIGGILAGGLVSALGLSTASLVSEQPAGFTPPEAPLVDAPQVESVEPETDTASDGPSSPVGSISIEEPQAPALPEGEGGAGAQDLAAPEDDTAGATAPRADTDPLDEPEVVAIEGAMEAPDTSDGVAFAADLDEPVLPNPQGQAPQTPNTEADLTVSTAPAQPVVVVDDEGDSAPVVDETVTPEQDTFVVDLGADAAEDVASENPETEMADVVEVEDPAGDEPAPDATPEPEVDPESEAVPQEDVIAALNPEAEANDGPEVEEDTAAPRLQLQGGENSLLADRDTGVTIRRPAGDATEASGESSAPAETGAVGNALVDFAATYEDAGSKPLMSVVLIDDGSMSAAAAALSGLPFPVTIAIDPSMDGAANLMARYRADGFEVAALAKLPEGALPSDVEITFESVFGTLPDAVAVLDAGEGGLQADRAVTEQAMSILASQGRGFINASQGLNMAGRAADQAGVPAAVIYRDLDNEGQDARVVRRFIDQAAFRARQESGVVLVGRVRPDTISALILWGTANQDEQVALVPVSAVLTSQ